MPSQPDQTLTTSFSDKNGQRYKATFRGTTDNLLHALRVCSMVMQGQLYGDLLTQSVAAVPGLKLAPEARL